MGSECPSPGTRPPGLPLTLARLIVKCYTVDTLFPSHKHPCRSIKNPVRSGSPPTTGRSSPSSSSNFSHIHTNTPNGHDSKHHRPVTDFSPLVQVDRAGRKAWSLA